jgi:hypothetical protein
MESHSTNDQSNGNSFSRALKAEQQAEGLFAFFVFMGHDRSLEKLHAHCTDIGLKISLSTLKNYSRWHNWQVRLQEMNDAVKAQLDHRLVEDVVSMNARQAQLGAALQGLGSKGVESLSARIDEMSFGDAGALIERGVKVQRLAMGEVTSRTEARVHAYTEMVGSILEVFQTVAEKHALPQNVIDEFVIGADAVVTAALYTGEHKEEVVA